MPMGKVPTLVTLPLFSTPSGVPWHTISTYIYQFHYQDIWKNSHNISCLHEAHEHAEERNEKRAASTCKPGNPTSKVRNY
jgi:hypothetical protein